MGRELQRWAREMKGSGGGLRAEGKVGGSSFGIEQVIGDLLLNSLRSPVAAVD